MDCKNVRIGIMGGTFDPIHHGHLLVAEEVREQFELDKVVFIPSGAPPHKRGTGVTGAEERYEMVRLAISTNPYFEASRIEMERDGYTYTIDTLRQLKVIYGGKAELFFIIGADVVHDLTNWRSFEQVFGECRFIAVLRPGFNREGFLGQIDGLKDKYGAVIYTAEAPLVDISSTGIRSRIGEGRSIRYYVPQSVEEYIYKIELYTDWQDN